MGCAYVCMFVYVCVDVYVCVGGGVHGLTGPGSGRRSGRMSGLGGLQACACLPLRATELR